MSSDGGQIRRARSADSTELTRLVRESNAYVGEYRPMVQGIIISPEQIARDLVYVYERDQQVLGFYSLIQKSGAAELDFMFVDNDAVHMGIGRQLFPHMAGVAQQLGASDVLIVAHPPAEAFYARMGAITIVVQPPTGRVTWARPRMVVKTHLLEPLPDHLAEANEHTENIIER